MIHDNYIIKKTVEEYVEVLKPKVTGLVNIDEATKDIAIDFLICFSSIAGIFGNTGQADYAAANAFMDAYTRYRNRLVERGERQGRTISISWPLWEEGGMRIDKETEKMLENTGMKAMETERGIKALYKAIASEKDQVTVLEGNLNK